MAKRKSTGSRPAKAAPSAGRKRHVPTEEEIEARRERVLELWGKSDRRIARTLIDEGWFKPPASRLAVDQAKFEDGCRRNVCNDRAAIRESWRKKKRNSQDARELTEDYIARLQMRIEEIDDLLSDRTLKPTPRMLALSEIRQLEALIAKARGSDAAPDAPSEDENKPPVPFVGLVLDLSKCSGDVAKQIRGEDDDGAGSDK